MTEFITAHPKWREAAGRFNLSALPINFTRYNAEFIGIIETMDPIAKALSNAAKAQVRLWAEFEASDERIRRAQTPEQSEPRSPE
jgi:hypothetical protein